MWIKICGNTNLEDCLKAAELGADALGFVFAPSVRRVTAAQAALIIAQLPDGIEKVGVFPAWQANEIASVVEEAGLTTVQLHGGFDPALARELAHYFHGRVRIIHILHWDLAGGPSQADTLMQRLAKIAPECDAVLIDSKAGPLLGGTGQQFDWHAARPLFSAHPRAIVAGGLTPDNVHGVIQKLNPWGVDVVSGVEAAPGKKDHRKLEHFFHQARRGFDSPKSTSAD